MEFSRRNFLKGGLAAAGALALGGLLPSQELFAAGGRRRNSCRGKAKRVLLISLDGICVEGFKQAETPHLDKLLAGGVVSETTRVVMPSVTLPNWTSHLTGSGPEQHGVTDNGWTLDKHKLPGISKDAEGYYPSVFAVLKEKMPQIKTAFYYNWEPLFYPYNPKCLDEANYLENDAYVPNYEKAFDFMDKNRQAPALVFLYSVHTDHAGHKYKWMSPEYIRSIEEADAEIGKLLEKMRQADLYDDTHFFFLTDHGGIGRGHGGVSTHEMIVPWGIAGPGIAEGVKMEEANNTVNTAAVILSLFGVDKPDAWTGEVPETIFK